MVICPSSQLSFVTVLGARLPIGLDDAKLVGRIMIRRVNRQDGELRLRLQPALRWLSW
jgi:hypothetical protein